MKKFYLISLLALLMGFSVNAQQTWDNFEDLRKGTYGFINGVFIPYNGNPDPTGVNTSEVAAQYIRNSVEMFDVLILDAGMADLSDYLSGAKSMSIDVWSPAPGQTVQITLENSVLAEPANFPTGRHSVYIATTSTSMAWETLTFNFDNQPDPGVANDNVDRLVLLFQPGTNSGDTWYFDNLNGPELSDDPCDGVAPDLTVAMDFECNQNLNFTFSHSGVNFRRVVNPDMNGNTSAYVASYVRNGGEENDVIIASNGGGGLIPANAAVEIDVWDPAAPTDVVMSFQQDGVEVAVQTVSTSNSSVWETLNFNLTEFEGAEFNEIVILFDPGNFSSDNYFFDNIVEADPIMNVAEALNEVSAFTAFPNPAQDEVQFKYELNTSADVQLTLFNATGQVVSTIFSGRQVAGEQAINFDASQLQNGLYFYTLSINSKVATGSITIAH